MRTRILVFTAVWILSGFLATQAQSQPCSCSDAKDMLYRLKEADAAINEYKKQIQNYEAQERSSGNPVMFTLAEYRNNLQPAVQAVLNDVRSAEPPPPPKSARAKTDQHSCNTVVSGGSSCLQEAVNRHEIHHSNTCSIRKPSPLEPASDYRDGMKMVEFVQEEITGYTLEKAYLSGEFAKLPDKCKPPKWYLYYEVTVAGEGGKIQTSSGTRNEIKWKIYHRYSGKIEFNQPNPQLPFTPQQQFLMTSAQIMEALKKYPVGSVVSWRHQLFLVQLFVPMEVFIKDEVIRFVYEPGEADAYEQTTTTETWDGDYTDGVSNEFEFFINSPDNKYNITIPIGPLSQAITKVPPQVKNVTKEVIDRTKYGYGGKPTHEEPPPETKMISLNSLTIPTVAGLLEKAKVHHPENLPLNFIEDTLTFDSGEVKPTLPYLKGLPDAEKNVKVKVYYRLSKLPM